MKPTKLIIKNIGKIANEVIEINKPLILFYGEIKQGKTTILNSVRWVCGGEFPDDIIRHGEKDAVIELHFDGGLISRTWYRAKTGETKARPVVFIRNGKPVAQPVSEIKRLLNPFLLDQDFLRNKTELERKQYFTELFAVDTTALDTELFNNQREATALRAKITGYGEIDLKEVLPVDVSVLEGQLNRMKMGYAEERKELESQLEKLDAGYRAECNRVDEENEKVRAHNLSVERAQTNQESIRNRIAELKTLLQQEEAKLEAITIPPVKVLLARPEPPDRSVIQKKLLDIVPDTSALEKQIQEAGAINVRAEQYQADKKRADQKKADEQALAALEKRGREIKTEKQAKLKGISESSGISGLSFDDSGNFIYDGTTAGMISDSQIMRLSSELSALYPEGFGLDLIDRAESLGKSIFEFVDKAKAENKSILATIVGEKPAKVPADVGVFVIEDGRVVGAEPEPAKEGSLL